MALMLTIFLEMNKARTGEAFGVIIERLAKAEQARLEKEQKS